MNNHNSADVQEAFHRVVLDHDVKQLAGQMGMSPGVLYNKANYHDNENNHNKPTLSDAIVLTNISGDKRIAQAFCYAVGGLYHELPDLSHLTLDALFMHILKIEVEGADFWHALHNALKDDDRIDAREYVRIEREAHEWIAAIFEGLARMKEMSK